MDNEFDCYYEQNNANIRDLDKVKDILIETDLPRRTIREVSEIITRVKRSIVDFDAQVASAQGEGSL